MTLLREILDRPLDPGYAAAAERRERAGRPRSSGTHSWLLLVAALLIGFVVVVAALELRPSGTTASRDKQQLIDQISARQAHGDAQTAVIDRLRGEIASSQNAALGTQATSLRDELARLDVLTGDVSVEGPGLTVTVDDAPGVATAAGSPRDAGAADDGRVTSQDLQVVVNGLWQAGAEAVSVNGQRLTARSAIRFAGQAILVDYRPLTTPYVITAVGSADALPATFATTLGGSYLTALRDNYQIPSTISPQAHVVVPRSATLSLTYARTVPDGIPSSSGAGGSSTAGGTSTTGGPSTSAPDRTTGSTGEETP